MEQFNLIIQKTTTGLTVEYASPGIDPQHPNVIKTLEDERAFATQIVKESDVYSLEITDHYRIYSLIVIDSDKFGRSGFYEFKLYGPRDCLLENFDAILQEIKERYNEDTSTKPYESILSSIRLIQNNSITDYISVKRNYKKYYSFYDEANLDSLKEIFKEKGSYLISKLYALNKSKAYKEDVIQSVGLLPFSLGHFREVIISNPDRVLKELFLNNEILKVNTFKVEFKILVEPNDVLTYSTTDSKTIKTIPGSFAEIKRKPVYKPDPTNYPQPKKKSFLQENGVYLLALVIMIGGLGFSIFKYPSFYGLKSDEQPPNFISVEQNTDLQQDSITPLFDKTYSQDSIHYIPLRKGLNHYIFSYSNNLWFYKNTKGQKTYNKFTKSIVEELTILDSTSFTAEEQINFIAALEKQSGKLIDSIIAKEIESAPDVQSAKNRSNINDKKNQINEREKQDETDKLKNLNPIPGDLSKSDN